RRQGALEGGLERRGDRRARETRRGARPLDPRAPASPGAARRRQGLGQLPSVPVGEVGGRVPSDLPVAGRIREQTGTTGGERFEPLGESLRDRDLTGRRAVGGLDLLATVGVETEASLVALTQVKHGTRGSLQGGSHGRPEGRHADVRPPELPRFAEGRTLET